MSHKPSKSDVNPCMSTTRELSSVRVVGLDPFLKEYWRSLILAVRPQTIQGYISLGLQAFSKFPLQLMVEARKNEFGRQEKMKKRKPYAFSFFLASQLGIWRKPGDRG